MAPSFSKGPGGNQSGGMSMGGGPTIISQSYRNQAVLDALSTLTGQNFGFDKQAWKAWYSAQRKPAKGFDPRRGNPMTANSQRRSSAGYGGPATATRLCLPRSMAPTAAKVMRRHARLAFENLRKVIGILEI